MTNKRATGTAQGPAFISKISAPAPATRVVRRERLAAALLEPESARIHLVRAPAGFGKTTLLLELTRESGAAVCWLSLDDWDREVLTFLQYLRSSVLSQVASEGSGGAHQRERDPRAQLTQIVSAIEAAGRDVWLVLDDFHCLDGAVEVLDLVDHLLLRLPANCRITIASRTAPELPSLPRQRLLRRVSEVGSGDLAFTHEEVRACLAVAGAATVSDPQVEDILARTQGWPAAVVSLGVRRGDLAGQDDQGEAMAEYLAAEVLDRLPESLQGFLVSTSILDELTPDSCDALLRTEGSGRTLKLLSQQNVPLLREQGATGTALRVHAVLRDFLQERLRSTRPDDFRTLHRLAAEWCAGGGRAGESIRHYAAAQEWALAGEVIENEAPAAYKLGRWHAVASWLKLLPLAEVRLRPALRVWEARILVRLGQPLEALRVINETLTALGDSEPAVAAELESIRSAAMRTKGDVSTALAAARRSVALALSSNAPLQVLSDARLQLGSALFADGSFNDAANELSAVLEMCELRGDHEQTAFVSGLLGSALGSAGKLVESIVHLEQARHQWQLIGNAKELSWVINNLAMTYANMGQIDRARELFSLALSKARDSEYRRIEAFALDSLADIEREEGNPAGAVKLYQQALDICKDLGEMSLRTLALTGLADTYRRLGDVAQAESLARQVVASAKERGATLEEGLGLLALGKISRQAGHLDEAVSAFSAAATLFEGVDARREFAEALLRLVDALLPRRGNRPLVKETLERLVEAARDLGEDAPLLRAAASMPAVARYAVTRHIGGGFFSQFIKANPAKHVENPASVGASASKSLPTVEVDALGPFECRVDGRPLLSIEWQTEKSRELLLLLLTREQPLRRDEIISALWPDIGGKRGTNHFHITLHRLRRALHPECVLEAGGKYFPNPAATFVCDAVSFRRSYELAEAAGSTADSVSALESCVTLYGGPFAAEIESEWADQLRLELEERFLRSCSQLGSLLMAQARYVDAARVLERLLASDPYNEDGCGLLMEALLAQNDREGASRVYRQYARLLEQDLGEHPGTAIQKLYRRVRDRTVS